MIPPFAVWSLSMFNDAIVYDRYGPPAAVLTLQRTPLAPLAGGRVRVRMRYAPVNPSDLIPVTGAYRHRTRLPAVAGYEGLGEVVAAPYGSRLTAGQRVLPLRGGGTWQRFIDLDETWLVPVPPAVDDLLAARGYINPLTAMLMLKRWPVAGRHLVLTAASSSCASLLGQWALAMGARSVSGIIRSPQHRARLEQAGIYPILDTDRALMEKVSQHSDLVFDAVGGELANTLLSVLPGSSTLISYGLLSGRPLTQTRGSATVRKFHLREALPTLSVAAWRAAFDEIWQRLPTTSQPPAQRIALNDWREAIAAAGQPGRGGKILLDFTAG
ncbi:zinc-dependent alcohol dehydrogenase family protein [Klebsiella pneumoniae]|uniref:zinc-dependent alcohol dehydrogenase family protein n=1 Tax=Klebsiella pneumoniae TaxID=573 RepID=UPI0004109148|nr:zinc-dependent alcohol dehydrogenase family protein [Klebsiella pneumoniae]EIV2090441.1 zinc-dependent alcohol dehydrogenase family protein [Klebsiella pneumoniae subsp. ozaenae]EIW3880758.1 zinc-dependent alcohol dehydrogenase family protein [Klebsiella pneumoniae]EIX9210869.1 zinc-dependent alcohol dehydrogenase family protein [Klebsiella pneumoniae]EIX9308667.1 zinc-dependent alcohol dehydrogenase family protein [Klebsiella pneumoniae]EJM0964253.1 zinc-dependent alcohol dehydrogenase fam